MEYSSGRRSTRRLDYGGDRQANAALHRIVFTRLRHDPRTQALRTPYPGRQDPTRGHPMPQTTQPGRSSTWSDQCPAPPRYRGVRERRLLLGAASGDVTAGVVR
ncbi:hypothetical protein [Streptomyces nigra]|uniref:Transposase n=1 Tax=Streptomyces nigra TaxID=1827580 RepID=A0ABZ1J6C0_9ACTN